jgi:hypothetical protein
MEVGPVELTPHLLTNLHARLPHTSLPRWSEVSAAGLSPVHFRGLPARQVSCYALFKGWLLLSLPPCCLSRKTPFSLALSQHLGALTSVWVVPLAGIGLTPTAPSPGFCAAHAFGVRKEGGPFGPYPPIGALQHGPAPPGPDLDQFRREPAITGLDGRLAPSPRSEE